ncbi:MAG: hypothetical protein H0V70_24150 [Ktedonobacteraceae bacterium]|nr:hypothetical protein [Ktedonobacteraceae bacterium]
MNSNQKIMRFFCYLVPVLFVLTLIWHNFGPLLFIALVVLFVVARQSGSFRILGSSSTPPVYYQPKQQTPAPASGPEPLPRQNPPVNFDLTAEEYRQLSKTYQQGYQVPTPQLVKNESAMPKQDRAIDYEQPQAQYE